MTAAGSGARSAPRDATIAYPGGIRARWRWSGSGQGAAVFALSEAGGTLEDLGPLVSASFEELCRAELRIDGPGGPWTARLASTIYDEPAGLANAIERLEALEPSIRPAELQAWARQFSEEEFLRKMGAVLEMPPESKTSHTHSRNVR